MSVYSATVWNKRDRSSRLTVARYDWTVPDLNNVKSGQATVVVAFPARTWRMMYEEEMYEEDAARF